MDCSAKLKGSQTRESVRGQVPCLVSRLVEADLLQRCNLHGKQIYVLTEELNLLLDM
ncbi:hypothetical protein F2Q68_00043645 [Brassica cretica]|uniref:Uncharacterized protein n=1 Tax=Brassica cretica TaxID=69181 RepID=A0A8S9LHT6_BRACR|nr:hypothetical protein F2Q68_00043645 [Brassica cretica]